MTAAMTAEILGYLAAGLVFLTFCMKTMIPLRVAAVGSNIAFIGYAVFEGLVPILILHGILLPLNSFRLFQMQRLINQIREAATGDLSFEGFLPYMTKRRFTKGDILFSKGDISREMFYVLEGSIHLSEIDKMLDKGEVLGEISMFSPNKQRTATAICETDGELLAINDEKVLELYYQNPQFGFYLIQLITRRLIENCAMAEASFGRRPAVEGLRAAGVAASTVAADVGLARDRKTAPGRGPPSRWND